MKFISLFLLISVSAQASEVIEFKTAFSMTVCEAREGGVDCQVPFPSLEETSVVLNPGEQPGTGSGSYGVKETIEGYTLAADIKITKRSESSYTFFAYLWSVKGDWESYELSSGSVSVENPDHLNEVCFSGVQAGTAEKFFWPNFCLTSKFAESLNSIPHPEVQLGYRP